MVSPQCLESCWCSWGFWKSLNLWAGMGNPNPTYQKLALMLARLNTLKFSALLRKMTRKGDLCVCDMWLTLEGLDNLEFTDSREGDQKNL